MKAASSLSVLCLLSACAVPNREPLTRPDVSHPEPCPKPCPERMRGTFPERNEEPDRFWYTNALWLQHYVFWEFLRQKYNKPIHGPMCTNEKTLKDLVRAFADPLKSLPQANAKSSRPVQRTKGWKGWNRTRDSWIEGEKAVLKAYEAFRNEVRKEGERMLQEHKNSPLYKEFDRRLEEFDRRKSPARVLFEELRNLPDQLKEDLKNLPNNLKKRLEKGREK